MIQGEIEVSGLNSTASDPTVNIATQTIEMQENVSPYSPPIHSGPSVITSQPHGRVQQPRRPIPLNTLDWISTPRSQLSALSGTHFLGNVDQLEIQQIVDLSTLLGRSERRFQYRVKVPKAETLFLAMETRPENRSGPFSCSKLFGDDFELNILDQCGESAFVGSASLIGTVEENCGIIGTSFTIYDETRKKLCNIFGPNVCGCCMYKEAQFQVISIDGTHQIASLMHQWDNITSDYTSLITFPADTDVKLKSLLLAAAFLVEHVYFERMRRRSARI